MRDTLFIWVEAYEYPSGLRIGAFLWSASIILGRFMKGLFSSIILLKVEHYLFFISFTYVYVLRMKHESYTYEELTITIVV